MADPNRPVQILGAYKVSQYVLAGAGRPGARGAVQSASSDKAFLILDVVLANPGGHATVDQFTLDLGGATVPATLVALRPKVLPPGGMPRLFSRPIPGIAEGPAGPRRFKVVFEVPRDASQGKLRWGTNPEVNWSLGQTAVQ